MKKTLKLYILGALMFNNVAFGMPNGMQTGLNAVGGEYPSLNLFGATNATGPVKVTGSFELAGVFTGTVVETESLRSNGTINATELKAKTVSHNGMMVAKQIKCGAISIEGGITSSSVEADVFRLALNSDSMSSIKSIDAGDLAVTSTKGRLEVETIKGKQISVEACNAKRIEGDSVTIGKDCVVGELYYHTAYSVDPSARVGKITQY